jgi:hypothetical protein
MTDQNNQNGTPNINSVTLIDMPSNGHGIPNILMGSRDPTHLLIQELTGLMTPERTHGPPPGTNYHPGQESKSDDDDPSYLEDYNDDDDPLEPRVENTIVGQGVIDNLMVHDVGAGMDEVKERKVVHVTNNKEIQGTSEVSSIMDKDGNIEIKVTYGPDSYKCCVCYEGIVGPIVSCDNAHPLCSECIMGIKKTGDHRCPMCRSNTKGRNYLLENALLDMIKTCPFTKQGCRHRSYPENMKEHTTICRYAEIDCPWCGEKTTPFDLQTHTESLCKKQFSGMSCSNRIDFIKSDKINNVFIVSAMEESRILYVEKTETDCNMLCIQGTNSEDQINLIVMTYNIDVESLGDMKLTETRKIMLPIHKPEHLIKGQVLMHTISREELAGHKNIVITGFKEKYMTGGRWMVLDYQQNWYRATIRRRLYNPDRILVKFNIYPADKYDEWVTITDNKSERIRPLTANDGRTTSEERRHMDNLTEDEQLRLIMERSMNEM